MGNWREMWESAVDGIETRFLRTEFEDGEYEIHKNAAAGTITIIHKPSNSCLELTDTTGAHYDSQGRIVLGDKPSGYRTPEVQPETAEEPRCLNHSEDCHGKVEYHHNPDRDDLKTFPRCEFHQAIRLRQAEETNRKYGGDVPPADFDPTYAGERWDEED